MKKIATLIIILFAQGALAEMLCPTENEHELAIGEAEYTMENAIKAINNLEKGVPELIAANDKELVSIVEESQKNNKPIDITHFKMNSVLFSEQFYISYPNRLAIIKGALLKQNVLALKNAGKTQEYKDALQSFCNYVKTTSYVD